MEYAARALRQSEVPIKEISHRLGFQNQYHFSRVFRRYLGSPPSTYRDAPK
ncbi:MAG: helix-turn-helix domain-containing protein [Opitutaceae bacterium]